jgi:hypothetical protein
MHLLIRIVKNVNMNSRFECMDIYDLNVWIYMYHALHCMLINTLLSYMNS